MKNPKRQVNANGSKKATASQARNARASSRQNNVTVRLQSPSGDTIEDIELPRELYEQVEREAKERGQDIGQFICGAVSNNITRAAPEPSAAMQAASRERNEPIIPAHCVIEFKDACAILESKVNAALALAVMNADMMRDAVNAFAEWQTYDLPGVCEGIFTFAHDLSFAFESSFDKWHGPHKNLMDRLRDCQILVPPPPMSAPAKTILDAAGCNQDRRLEIALEKKIDAVCHCLELQGLVMGNRQFEGAHGCSDVFCDDVRAAWKSAALASYNLGRAVVAVELSGSQRAAA